MKAILIILFLLPVFCFSQNIKHKQLDSNLRQVPYVIGNGKFKVDSINTKPVALPGIADSLMALGNSITAGQLASTTDSAYISRYKTSLGVVLEDRSVSGRGIWVAATNANTNFNPGASKMTTLMAGFNDVRRTDTTNVNTYRRTQNKVINGTKNIIQNQFLSRYFAAGSASVTRSGSWSTGYLSNTVSGKTTNGAFTNTNNDSLTYTFTDSTIAIGFIYGDGITEIMTTSVQIYIDGALRATLNLNNGSDGISDGANTNDRIAGAWFANNLGYTSHRLSIINRTATRLAVDYVGHFRNRSDMYPIVIFHAPKMDATGYSTSPAGASDAVIDLINTRIDSLVATMPGWWPIYTAQTNNYYIATTSSGLSSTDHIHPNDLGHRQIWQAGLAALSDVNFLPIFGTLVTQENGRLNFIDSFHRARKVAFTDELSAISDPINIIPTANQVHLTTKNYSTQTTDGYQHLANDGTVKFKIDNGGGLQILGGINNLITSASSLEIEQPSANTSYITQLNRGSGTYGTLNLRASPINIAPNGTTKVAVVTATTTVSNRLVTSQGASVASANNLTLGSDGNTFEITGTTQINLIANTNWANGSVIRLVFTSTPTVKNGQTTSGANITILLAGAADFAATADDVLTLMLCTNGGVQAWREIGRSVN